MLTKLDEREATIINLRFGIDGRKALTLEEVGEKFKVTRERVRQIQNIALAKLRRYLEKHERINTSPEDSTGEEEDEEI
jgi:RNA polymerase primary sigma factor